MLRLSAEAAALERRAGPATTPAAPAAGLERLRGVLTAAEYRAWVAPCRVSEGEHEVLLTAPTEVIARWLQERLDGQLARAWPGEIVVVEVGP